MYTYNSYVFRAGGNLVVDGFPSRLGQRRVFLFLSGSARDQALCEIPAVMATEIQMDPTMRKLIKIMFNQILCAEKTLDQSKMFNPILFSVFHALRSGNKSDVCWL